MLEPAAAENEGFDLGRMIALSDGVFAFAMTLVAVSVEVPRLPGAELDRLTEVLVSQLPDLLGYAISFAVVGWLWVDHHRLFGALARADGGMTALNFLYLGLVALTPVTADLLGDYIHRPEAAIINAFTLAAVVFVNTAMWRYSANHGLLAGEAARGDVRGRIRATAVPGLVFLISMPIAFAQHDCRGAVVALDLPVEPGGDQAAPALTFTSSKSTAAASPT